MADDPTPKTGYTPEELREAKGDFDAEQLAHRDEQSAESLAKGKPQPTAAELAEQQRLDDKDDKDNTQSRDERLVRTGRGHHTAGRLGGIS